MMALIQCPECRASISDKAISCPKCGKPINTVQTQENDQFDLKRYGGLIIALIAIAIIVCFCWYANDQKAKNKALNQGYYSALPKTGNQGALEQAKSYISHSSFSYEGLIHQLEYHGFSYSEAKYGADNCGADWNEQAVKSAKSYISHSAFSYSKLIEQLEYEKYTEKEAKYGADHCDANWKEEAYEQAKSYMKSFPDWTKSELERQLDYEDFTPEQVQYALNLIFK